MVNGGGRVIIFLILAHIFIRLYSGFTLPIPTSDNSNIGFNLPVIILFPVVILLAYSVVPI